MKAQSDDLVEKIQSVDADMTPAERQMLDRQIEISKDEALLQAHSQLDLYSYLAQHEQEIRISTGFEEVSQHDNNDLSLSSFFNQKSSGIADATPILENTNQSFTPDNVSLSSQQNMQAFKLG